MSEQERLFAITAYERALWETGTSLVAGIDEVGRGPLVGPVVTACVIMPWEPLVEGVKDSKKLTEKRREALYDRIREEAVCWSIGMASAAEIDRINILNATKLAMQRAVEGMAVQPEHLLVDALQLDTAIPCTAIVKGDALSYSIGAASILAKVTRDRMMRELDERYPLYGFAKHKGYGTKEHREALLRYGPIPEHRQSFIRKIAG